MTTPALLTRRSRPPKASTAAWTARPASAASVTLPATAMARPPAPVTRPVFPVKRAYEPAILVLRLSLECPGRPAPFSRAGRPWLGQLDPAALADAGHGGIRLEQHGLQDHLARRAAREMGAGLAPGPGAAHAVAGDRAGGLHRDGVGPLIPRPALAGHDLLPEPGLAERVQRPAEPDAQAQPGVGDREVAAGEVAQ